jgi:hypothetical protein
MGVRTPMVDAFDAAGGSAGLDGLLSPDEVAAAAIEGLRDERFLVFPHAKVAEYYAKKAANPDKWLARMAALQERFTAR